jgi:outer membrane protein with beta-barrel domain
MKKLTLILLVLAVTLGSTNVFGQGAPKPIFGAKAGPNFANIGGETDNKMKTSFHAGVYAEVFFDYFLMMQMELLLSNQGHAADPALPSASSLDLWYLNLPIMARYNLGYNFNVHAGIQLGFLLSATSKFTDPFTGEKFTSKVNDQFKAIDLGLPIGVGYEFWDRKLNVTVRYILPLTDISKITGPGQKRTNKVFQVSLGIMLFRVGA